MKMARLLAFLLLLLLSLQYLGQGSVRHGHFMVPVY
jgi:hypothetical protein